eukprot:GHVU01017999.1.p3 GENE.GHVU01017999.1~~GHVU01017999.1.p3  ORF type:complete len:155 (+),score=10.45 GHVU01017999.1:550-1014(+)
MHTHAHAYTHARTHSRMKAKRAKGDTHAVTHTITHTCSSSSHALSLSLSLSLSHLRGSCRLDATENHEYSRRRVEPAHHRKPPLREGDHLLQQPASQPAEAACIRSEGGEGVRRTHRRQVRDTGVQTCMHACIHTYRSMYVYIYVSEYSVSVYI